jgi:hypothetical protein
VVVIRLMSGVSKCGFPVRWILPAGRRPALQPEFSGKVDK